MNFAPLLGVSLSFVVFLLLTGADGPLQIRTGFDQATAPVAAETAEVRDYYNSLAASQLAYDDRHKVHDHLFMAANRLVENGFQLVSFIKENNTGFTVSFYQKESSNPAERELLVAFSGTESPLDVLVDAGFGYSQMKSPAMQKALDKVRALCSDCRLTVTGHSLGGALAQYASYEILNNTPRIRGLNLYTWNALGAEPLLSGIHGSDFKNGFPAPKNIPVVVHHYRIAGDPISRLVKPIGNEVETVATTEAGPNPHSLQGFWKFHWEAGRPRTLPLEIRAVPFPPEFTLAMGQFSSFALDAVRGISTRCSLLTRSFVRKRISAKKTDSQVSEVLAKP